MRGRVTARLAVFVGLLLVAAGLSAQASEPGPAALARAEVTASARVVGGLAIQKTQDLNLGEVRAGTSAGLVRVEILPGPVTGRSAAGGVALTGSAFNAAQFNVMTGGAAGPSPLQVSLPASATLSRVGGAETMTAQDFRASLAPSCTAGPRCAGAPYVLLVGATLSVGAEQPAGSYQGTFMVTVNQF